jgi:hypothetical protein
MIIAAIDSGVKNFALSIECVLDEVIGLDVDTVALSSETLYFQNHELNPVDPVQNVTRILDSLSEYWTKCGVVLVERQVQYRGIVNTAALRIAHHCLSYFSILYPTLKCIDYPSANKTQQLGAPSGLSKPERKKWSTRYAERVLRERGDLQALSVRENMHAKLDDVSDCLLMCIAYASSKKSKSR